MNRLRKKITLLFSLFPIFYFCQENELKKDILDALKPTISSYYSAVLPGLGQAYNKKYWKIPIVYAGIGSGIYFYKKNNSEYKRYRNAYKRRLAGFTDDEFYGSGLFPNVSNDGLIRAQNTLKRNKELSILVSVIVYILNIIDANVDAHLKSYNIDDKLTIKAIFSTYNSEDKSNFGLSINLNL